MDQTRRGETRRNVNRGGVRGQTSAECGVRSAGESERERTIVYSLSESCTCRSTRLGFAGIRGSAAAAAVDASPAPTRPSSGSTVEICLPGFCRASSASAYSHVHTFTRSLVHVSDAMLSSIRV